MCILCHIFTNYSSVLFYGMIYYARNNYLWLSAHTSFSVPNATDFYRFLGISRNNNCHWEMAIHVFPGHISPAVFVSLLTGLTTWTYAQYMYLIALLQCTCTLHWSAAQCSHTCTWLMAVPFHQLCFINTCALHSVYEIISIIWVSELSQSLSFSFSEWFTPMLLALQ